MLHFMDVKKTKYRGSINGSNQEGLPSNLKGKTLHLIKFRFQKQSIFGAEGYCQNNCKTTAVTEFRAQPQACRIEFKYLF